MSYAGVDHPREWPSDDVWVQGRQKADLDVRVFTNVNDLNHAAWTQLAGQAGDDVAWGMTPGLLAFQQETLSDQGDFWFVELSENDRIVGVAALALLTLDLVQEPIRAARIGRMLRRFMPRLLRARVLFCGLPLPPGQHHLALDPRADKRAALEALDNAMRKLAHRHRAHFLVFKEFETDTLENILSLENRGYIARPVPPMHRLDSAFADLDAYRGALRHRYRNQIDSSLKKVRGSAFTIHHYTDADEIAAQFTEQLHGLYLQIWDRSTVKLECNPARLFRGLPTATDNIVILTVLEQNGVPVAFTYGIMLEKASGARAYLSLYSGAEQALNGSADLYFNIIYYGMDIGWRRGASEILLGQTADRFKARLGARPVALHCLVRARNPVLNWGVGLFSNSVFQVSAPKTHRVFRVIDQ